MVWHPRAKSRDELVQCRSRSDSPAYHNLSDARHGRTGSDICTRRNDRADRIRPPSVRRHEPNRAAEPRHLHHERDAGSHLRESVSEQRHTAGLWAAADYIDLAWGSSFTNCDGYGATALWIVNGDSGAATYSTNVLQVTSGASPGSTSVTLGSAPSGNVCGNPNSPNGCSGSVSNLRVGSLIAFNQLDEASETATGGLAARRGQARPKPIARSRARPATRGADAH